MHNLLSNGWLFAGGAALFTIAASLWGHLRAFYQRIIDRIVVQVTVTGYVADAVTLYLKSHFRPSVFGPREYLGWMLYVRPRKRVQLVPMEITSQRKVYWKGWKPLWTGSSFLMPGGVVAGQNARGYDEDSLSIGFFRGMFDADALIVAASNWYNKQVVETAETKGRRHYVRHIHGTAGQSAGNHHQHRRHGRQPSSHADIRSCLHHRSLTWQMSDIGPERRTDVAPTELLALNAAARSLVEEAHRWKKSETWYTARGIPWRRGWLLYGRPGTGKTALARAVAEELDLPVYVFDLSSLHNHELQENWTYMLAEVPCMALIEDIDAVFDGRKNISSGNDRETLTFDCLLNCLDGIQRAEGLFVVISTNRLEKVDPALGLPDAHTGSTRPGRIDRVFELTELDEVSRWKVAARILREWPDEWEPLVTSAVGDTAAQFQERCARRALELYFDGMVPQPTKPSTDEQVAPTSVAIAIESPPGTSQARMNTEVVSR